MRVYEVTTKIKGLNDIIKGLMDAADTLRKSSGDVSNPAVLLIEQEIAKCKAEVEELNNRCVSEAIEVRNA